MRENGPKPGKNANRVGEMLAPYSSRLLCRTNSEPLSCVRIMKGAERSTFTIPIVGVRLIVERKSDGNEMPVSQLMSVRKV